MSCTQVHIRNGLEAISLKFFSFCIWKKNDTITINIEYVAIVTYNHAQYPSRQYEVVSTSHGGDSQSLHIEEKKELKNRVKKIFAVRGVWGEAFEKQTTASLIEIRWLIEVGISHAMHIGAWIFRNLNAPMHINLGVWITWSISYKWRNQFKAFVWMLPPLMEIINALFWRDASLKWRPLDHSAGVCDREWMEIILLPFVHVRRGLQLW